MPVPPLSPAGKPAGRGQSGLLVNGGLRCKPASGPCNWVVQSMQSWARLGVARISFIQRKPGSCWLVGIALSHGSIGLEIGSALWFTSCGSAQVR